MLNATDAEHVVIGIMAGGRSRRMGRDKARLPIGDETWLSRLAREAAASGRDVYVVGRARPADWPVPGVEFLIDERPGQGPLGGLLTLLHHAGRAVLALACDMPRVDRQAIAWLLRRAALHPDRPVVAVRGLARVQPLFAVYRPAVLDEAEARLARGQRSLKHLIAALGTEPVEAPEALAERLFNINDPGDLRRLESEGPAS